MELECFSMLIYVIGIILLIISFSVVVFGNKKIMGVILSLVTICLFIVGHHLEKRGLVKNIITPIEIKLLPAWKETTFPSKTKVVFEKGEIIAIHIFPDKTATIKEVK